MQEYGQKVVDWLLSSGIQIIVVLILAIIASKIVSFVLTRVFQKRSEGKDEELKKRMDTLHGVTSWLLTVVIFSVAGIIILGEVGIEIGALLAAAGVVGLAVGFGAQNIVRDVITGFFILLDDQIRVGDVVDIAGKAGLVEKINLRMTILRDLAGNVHFVRNGEVNVVTNMTKEYSRYVFEVGVAYREDVDQVIEVLRQIDDEMRQDPQYSEDILEPLEILGLDKFGDSAIIIKARTKTKPIKQWSIGREFNRRMKRRFDEMDIEIPFPHVTLYMGEDKQGTAPPMHVSMEKE